MMQFDHLGIPVSNLDRSRDWYVATLGLKVEFAIPERRAVALQDSADFTIFLNEVEAPVQPNGAAFWFKVEDVEASFAALSSRGLVFQHGPKKSFWGYGVELADPDGYLVRLWDETSMREK